jgi:hypothetical protein
VLPSTDLFHEKYPCYYESTNQRPAEHVNASGPVELQAKSLPRVIIKAASVDV